MGCISEHVVSLSSLMTQHAVWRRATMSFLTTWIATWGREMTGVGKCTHLESSTYIYPNSLFNSPTGKGGLGCPCCNKTRRDFDNAVLPTCKYTTSVSAGLLYVRYALDVVFAGIESPVRFHLPVVCRVLGRTERFFYPNRKALHVNYIVSLKALVPVFIDLR